MWSQAIRGVHSPHASDLGSMPPTPPGECQATGWRGDWSCCCRRLPHTAPECLFLFEQFLLLNPATPYKEGPVLSHSPPLQPDRGLSGSGPHMTQLSTLPSHTHSLRGFTTSSLSPPCNFKQPGLSQCCSSLVWQGWEPLTWLSPRSPVAGPSGAGLGLQLPWSLSWSQGPFCPEAVPLPSVFSVSSVLFGLLSS